MALDKESLRKSRQAVADAKGWKLNPDEKVVDMILEGLINNLEKHGALYCPCRMISGDKKEDAKIVCPCVYADDEVKGDGVCHCQLYVRKDE